MTEPDPDLLVVQHITQTAWDIWHDLSYAARDREWHWVIAPSTLTLFKKWTQPYTSRPFEPDPEQPGRFTLFGIPIWTDPETDHEIELRIWK